jgi:hypothetical protein
MSTLHATSAILAFTMMDYELSRHRADRGKIDLVLALLALQANPALAALTVQRTRHVKTLIDALRDGTSRHLAVLRSGLAP